MKSLMAIVLAISGSCCAEAATYVCETKRAYALNAGELRPYREQVELMSWRTVLFDDTTGILTYGHEAKEGPEELRSLNKAYWAEEKLVVASRGEVVAGHYMHNGTIFSALVINTFTTPVDFLWLRGGNSDALTGTCRVLGK